LPSFPFLFPSSSPLSFLTFPSSTFPSSLSLPITHPLTPKQIADLSEQNRQMTNIKQNLLRRLANVHNINHDETVTNLEAHVARLQNIITGGRSPLLEITMIISNDHEDERAARIADYQGYAAQIVGERRVAEDLGQQLRREKALTQSLRERNRRFKEAGRRHSI
jgi:hypothetical protein